MDRARQRWLTAALLLATATYAIAEDITLTTYYPSPRGVYNELRVGSGAGSLPSATLQVTKPTDDGNFAVRVDDQAGGDATPFIIDQNGNIGVGTTAIVTKLTMQDGNLALTGSVNLGPPAQNSNVIYFGQPTDGYAIGRVNKGLPTERIQISANDNPMGTNRLLAMSTNGNVGIATITPAFKLDVNGIVNGTDIYKNGVPFSTIPPGAVMFFSLPACPAGWSVYAAGQGRYLVGMPAGGTLGGTQGTALGNIENRPVGQHTHTTTPALINNDDRWVTWQAAAGGGFPAYVDIAPYGLQEPNWWGGRFPASPPNVTINTAGTVASTPAPYIQLLACQKN